MYSMENRKRFIGNFGDICHIIIVVENKMCFKKTRRIWKKGKVQSISNIIGLCEPK